MSNAAKSIKLVFRNLDSAVSDVIQSIVYWVMLYHPDASMKAEAQVITRGASGLLQRELQQSKTFELLQLLQPYVQLGAVPPQTLIMLLRKVTSAQGFDPDTLLIPDPKREMQIQAQMQGRPAPRTQPTPPPPQQDVPQGNPGAQQSPSPTMQFTDKLPSQDGRFIQNPAGGSIPL